MHKKYENETHIFTVFCTDKKNGRYSVKIYRKKDDKGVIFEAHATLSKIYSFSDFKINCEGFLELAKDLKKAEKERERANPIIKPKFQVEIIPFKENDSFAEWQERINVVLDVCSIGGNRIIDVAFHGIDYAVIKYMKGE